MQLMTYIIHLLVFSQCLFFMYIYEFSVKCNNLFKVEKSIENLIVNLFYLMGFCFIVVVYSISLRFEFYTTQHLIQYALMVLYSYKVIRRKERALSSISLSFLIVFFNSYVWEIIYHFSEYNINPLMFFNFREIIHLIVLPFLLSHYEIDKKIVSKKFSILLFINFLFSVLTIEVYPRIDSYSFYIPIFGTLVNMTHFINRVVSLNMVLDMFIVNTNRRENRRWWFE